MTFEEPLKWGTCLILLQINRGRNKTFKKSPSLCWFPIISSVRLKSYSMMDISFESQATWGWKLLCISVNAQVTSINEKQVLLAHHSLSVSYLLNRVFHFKRLCYDFFSNSFELHLVKHSRLKMTSTVHV